MDPPAEFVNSGLLSQSFEMFIMPELSEEDWSEINWMNYFIDRKSAEEIQGRSTLNDRTYRFLANWLFCSEHISSNLCDFDRSAMELIEDEDMQTIAKKIPIIKYTLFVEKHDRYPLLSENQIEKYINNFLIHGA